jgi:cyanophycinase-like exopeptidase
MGGSTENDEAMKWFLNRANGGDVLVLMVTGGDGYNDYMYSQLGVEINSVETIVFNNKSASSEEYIHNKINQAEAVWIAGGDQWTYITYWRRNAIANLINDAIINRNIVIGGTSAGMAIMGKYYFSAANGTVTSTEAMNNPYAENVTIDSVEFIRNSFLNNVITDTHFDNPNRKGRVTTFMARALTDDAFPLKGIACDEYTSVCIEPDGISKVFGNYPVSDDNAYFIQPNCELSDYNPEKCLSNSPLTWNYSGEAVKVYKVKGTLNGENTFNLNDWKTGRGGEWKNWYVVDGKFAEVSNDQIQCWPLSVDNKSNLSDNLNIFPNPTDNKLNISSNENILKIEIYNLQGTLQKKLIDNKKFIETSIEDLQMGIYIIRIITQNNEFINKLIKD